MLAIKIWMIKNKIEVLCVRFDQFITTSNDSNLFGNEFYCLAAK